jgi:hypothetical protein
MGSGVNGTGLSTFTIASTMLDIDEIGSVLGEERAFFSGALQVDTGQRIEISSDRNHRNKFRQK